MTQIRPRLDDDPELVADIQAYARSLRISFSTAVRILIRTALQNDAVKAMIRTGGGKP